jgi:hypothetical protein
MWRGFILTGLTGFLIGLTDGNEVCGYDPVARYSDTEGLQPFPRRGIGIAFGCLRFATAPRQVQGLQRRNDGVADLLRVHFAGAGGAGEDVAGAQTVFDDFADGGLDGGGFRLEAEGKAQEKGG